MSNLSPEEIERCNALWDTANNRLDLLIGLVKAHQGKHTCNYDWCLSPSANQCITELGSNQDVIEGVLHAATVRLGKLE